MNFLLMSESQKLIGMATDRWNDGNRNRNDLHNSQCSVINCLHRRIENQRKNTQEQHGRLPEGPNSIQFEEGKRLQHERSVTALRLRIVLDYYPWHCLWCHSVSFRGENLDHFSEVKRVYIMIVWSGTSL